MRVLSQFASPSAATHAARERTVGFDVIDRESDAIQPIVVCIAFLLVSSVSVL
jgi:hypothetical protein